MGQNTLTCPLCEKPMKPVFLETILNKYNVTYYYSEDCGFLRSERPYWIDEAYTQAISDMDTGILQRNINNSELLHVLLSALSIENGKFLDVAGGYGLLARLMRDKGFNCYTIDKYCENLFAKPFEPKGSSPFDVLFAFEVFEHIENAVDFLSSLFEQYMCRTIIFSTLIFKNKVPARDWWYYSFETGQHISFYQQRTLVLLAEKLGCNYYKINSSTHIISDKKISKLRQKLLKNKNFRRLYGVYVKNGRGKRTKTFDDHLLIKANLNKRN